MDYNFSDPLAGYGNVLFNETNYDSVVCILSNYQEIQMQNAKLELLFLVIVFLLSIDVAISVLRYMRISRLDMGE